MANQDTLDRYNKGSFLEALCAQAIEESKKDGYEDAKEILRKQRQAKRRRKREAGKSPRESSTLFVSADRYGVTDWDDIRALQDALEIDYAAKNRKIPIYVERRNIIYETIRTHDGLTRPELLEKVRPFGIKKTALYDLVLKMLKDGSIYIDLDRKLHINGRPRPLVAEWKAHNTYWKLTKAREAWAIAQFCEYLNKILFARTTRRAFPNPTNWEEQHAEKLEEFRIKCGEEPLSFEELKMVEEAMKYYFGCIPKFRVKAELNQDTEGGEKMITDYLQLSYLGRTMRIYKHKNKNGQMVERRELLGSYMSMAEMEEYMKNNITLHQSIRDKQRLARLFKEEQKKNNKLEYELQKARKTIEEIEEENKSSKIIHEIQKCTTSS